MSVTCVANTVMSLERSGLTALEILKQLKLRNESLALLLVDQRMPRMTGVEFLEQAMNIYPDAKRVLLTAYADKDAPIRSINKAKIDYYLMKPWEPPEENPYPVLDGLLDDWMASFRPPYEGIRVVGLRWSPKSHETRDFLARSIKISLLGIACITQGLKIFENRLATFISVCNMVYI